MNKQQQIEDFRNNMLPKYLNSKEVILAQLEQEKKELTAKYNKYINVVATLKEQLNKKNAEIARYKSL